MGGGLVAAWTNGPVHTCARAASHAAFAVWAWEELTRGANVVRRAVGAGTLAYIAADIEHRVSGR